MASQDESKDPTSASASASASGPARYTLPSPDKFTRVRVAGGERQGGKQYQEDSHFHWTSPNGVITVAAVFDGHGGLNGALASQTAKSIALSFLIANQIECQSWSENRWEAELYALFSKLHIAIREKLLDNGDSLGGGARILDDKGIVRFSSGEPVRISCVRGRREEGEREVREENETLQV